MFVLISKSVNNSELLKISSKSKIKPTDTPAEPIMCAGLNSLIWVNASYIRMILYKVNYLENVNHAKYSLEYWN